MNESLNLLETGNSSSASTEDILEHLSFSLYKQGNIERALYFAQDLLKINPEHPRIKGKIPANIPLLSNFFALLH